MKTEQQYKDLTIKEFTKAAQVYETDHAGIYEMCREDYPYIEKELLKEDFKDLLDCGCGTGAMISLLYEKMPDKNYTGIDITPKMIEAAKAKGEEPFLILLDGIEDPHNLGAFHHYPNPQKFFDSVFRVLKSGGRLILQDYTAPKGILWLMNHTEMPLANLIGHGDVAARSLDEVKKFCDKAGLKIELLKRGKKFRLHLVARKLQ